jgi:hypothetical protein
MITVDAVSNGWILYHDVDEEEVIREVFEHDGSEESQVQSFRRLLYSINHIIGPNTSRYSKHRLQLCIVSGDKYSGEDSESCEIQKYKT